MINIEHFITSQKLVWIKRLFKCSNVLWSKLLSSVINIDKIYKLGAYWSKSLALQITNPFWKEVLYSWQKLICNIKIENSGILTIPLWQNPSISSEPLFYPHWFNAGICVPLDLIKSDGNILTLDEVAEKYGVNTNFLEYLRVKLCLKTFLSKFSTKPYSFDRPVCPYYLRFILRQKSGSRYFYEILNKDFINLRLRKKWNEMTNIDETDVTWDKIYKICFKTTNRNDLFWLQYRIIQRILGVKSQLYKMNICNNNTCDFCQSAEETLIHLFVLCPLVKRFWQNLNQWLQQSLGLYLDLNPPTIIFGILENQFDSLPLNVINLAAKMFIWNCSRNSKPLQLSDFQNYMKKIYQEQQYMSKINNNETKFEASWSAFNMQ